MFSASRIKIILISVLLVFIAGAFYYVSGLRADLQQSQINNERLNTGIQEQQKLIDQMQKDFSEIKRINREINDENERQQREITALTNRFNSRSSGEARDFGNLASKRPDSMERLINKGTANAARCLELASGAEHTTQELSAVLPSQINTECPELANPSYEPLL